MKDLAATSSRLGRARPCLAKIVDIAEYRDGSHRGLRIIPAALWGYGDHKPVRVGFARLVHSFVILSDAEGQIMICLKIPDEVA